MKRYLAFTTAILLALTTGCKKEAEVKKEDVSLARKYAKWSIKVFKDKELNKPTTFLSKGEPVDLLAAETSTVKGKQTEVARVKLTDDTEGYISMANIADRPIVFTEKTSAYFRNNESSRVYHEISRGTMAFIISEKGHWVQIFIGNTYDENGKKKWLDKKWVKSGFSEEMGLVPDARDFESAIAAINSEDSSAKQINKARDTLKKLLDSGNFFSELAKDKLAELALREEDSPVTEIENKKIEITENSRMVTSNGGLRMRDSPDLAGNKIGLIPRGEIVELQEVSGELVTISGATGKWSKVRWKKKTGWVFGGLLSSDVKKSSKE